MSGDGGPELHPSPAGLEGAPKPPRRFDWQYAAGFAVVILGLVLVASYMRSGCDCEKAEPLLLTDDVPFIGAPVDPDGLVEAEISESRL